MALIANVNRDPKKSRPFKPTDFDPYAIEDDVVLDKDGLRRLLTAASAAKPKRKAP